MDLRFSFVFSQNLLKSRVFAIQRIGLFFPQIKVEQAHFLYLTTYLTTWGDFALFPAIKSAKIEFIISINIFHR